MFEQLPNWYAVKERQIPGEKDNSGDYMTLEGSIIDFLTPKFWCCSCIVVQK